MPEGQCGWLYPEAGGETPQALLAHFGPTIPVEIGFDPLHRHTSTTRPNIPRDEHPALVDTGAGTCCIDWRLAEALHLPMVDRQMMGGVHGQQMTNFYMGQMCIPSIQFVITGLFAGLDLMGGGFGQKAIIGRDLLAHHTMVYHGLTGSVTLSR